MKQRERCANLTRKILSFLTEKSAKSLKEPAEGGYPVRFAESTRASGAPVIAGAIRYAAQLVRGKVFDVAAAEFAAAKKAGLKLLSAGHLLCL